MSSSDTPKPAPVNDEPPYYIANTDSDGTPVVVENGARVVARPATDEAAATLAAELNRPWQAWQDTQWQSDDAEPLPCCEACGTPVDPDHAVLDGVLMVCPGCAPCTVAEFERMQQVSAEEDAVPAELRPLLAEFAAAWDARALSLARVARAFAPEPLIEQLPGGLRVQVVFGPDAGCYGTVQSGPDAGGYYAVKVDGRPADNWGGLWYYLRTEIKPSTVPPPIEEDRPWANDAAYAAEGQRLG